MNEPLDPKLAKVIALMRSTTHAGEKAAAQARAEAMAAAAGMTLDEAIASIDTPAPPSFIDISARVDEAMERAEPGFKARRAAEKVEKERQRLERRAAIIARYGSEEAALAPCEREQLLHRAVAPWRKTCNRPWHRWTAEVGECSHFVLSGDIPQHIRSALASAYPMPDTFAEAMAEQRYWSARQQDTEDVLGPNEYGDSGLDLTAELRLEMVRPLVEHELPATTFCELRDRLRYYQELEISCPEILAALVRDADALVAGGDANPSKPSTSTMSASHPSTQDTRDGQIRAALDADPTRSDRDIARAFGCSPTTIGKVRREMGLTATVRSVQRAGKYYQMSFGFGGDVL